MLTIEQTGLDCIVTIGAEVRTIKNCEALKLAATMFNKPLVEKYSPQEMVEFGFELK